MTKTTPSLPPEFPDGSTYTPLQGSQLSLPQLLARTYLHPDNLANTRDFSRAQVAIIFSAKHTFQSLVTDYGQLQALMCDQLPPRINSHSLLPLPCPVNRLFQQQYLPVKPSPSPTALQKCNRLLTGLSPNIRFKNLYQYPCYLTPSLTSPQYTPDKSLIPQCDFLGLSQSQSLFLSLSFTVQETFQEGQGHLPVSRETHIHPHFVSHFHKSHLSRTQHRPGNLSP